MLLHFSLYRAIKLTLPTGVGSIVLYNTSCSMRSGSLGQPIRVLSVADFQEYVAKVTGK